MDLPSFISEDMADTPPPATWRDFKRPKLRKFPKHDEKIEWQDYLGLGWDGIVFTARFGQGDPVAVKIVSYHSSCTLDFVNATQLCSFGAV